FAFGLFHGLGFASVLKEMGVGESSVGIALPLVSFNLGVETGQLAIAALILPLAWKAKESANLSRIAVPWLSAIIVIAGTFSFVVLNEDTETEFFVSHSRVPSHDQILEICSHLDRSARS